MRRHDFHLGLFALLLTAGAARSQPIDVEAQPLADNAKRVMRAFEELGYPFAPEDGAAIIKAANAQDARKLQELLDRHVLLFVHLNPEARVKAKRGDGPAILQQGGY